MKRSTRMIVALVVVLVLALTAVGVWAAPTRVGTVPVLADQFTAVLTDTINFGTGTVSVEANSSEGGTMTIEKVDDPEIVLGPLPEGWVILLDQAFDITIVDGSTTSVRICVPQTPDMENKSTVFHFWDTVTKTWVAIPTTTTAGNPPLVCGTGSSQGQYALLGK